MRITRTQVVVISLAYIVLKRVGSSQLLLIAVTAYQLSVVIRGVNHILKQHLCIPVSK